MDRPSMIVVDDEPAMAELINQIGRLEGFEVRVANGVKKFRELYRAKAADVIVSDLVMPDTDGIELIQELAEQGCSAGLILVSGYQGRYLEVAGQLADQNGLRLIATFGKPFSVEEMKAALHRAVATEPRMP